MIKIIVAEDDKFIAHAYRNALELNGYKVYMAGDGNKALALIKKHAPDLMLLDLVMPNRDGFETLKELRQNDTELPVIVLSNLGQASDIRSCKKYGISDYLIKSNTSMKEVLGSIEKQLKKVDKKIPKKNKVHKKVVAKIKKIKKSSKSVVKVKKLKKIKK